MKEESRDRTAEVKAASGEFQIARRDFCYAFEQEAGRLFSARECWYCRYGDFGILTEHPTQNGVCGVACRTGGVSGAACNETDNTIGSDTAYSGDALKAVVSAPMQWEMSGQSKAVPYSFGQVSLTGGRCMRFAKKNIRLKRKE